MPGTRIFSVATNLASDHCRIRRRWAENRQDTRRTETRAAPAKTAHTRAPVGASRTDRFEYGARIDRCLSCHAMTLEIERQPALILKEVHGFRVFEIMAVLYLGEGRVKHALADARRILADLVKRRCALVSKRGVCHPCSEMSSFVHPMAEARTETAGLDRPRENHIKGEDVADLLSDLEQNAEMIAQHGEHTDGIVHPLMQQTSGGTGQREPTGLNALVYAYIDLAYHGIRARTPGITCQVEPDLGAQVRSIEMAPQEIGRVLLDLFVNAFDVLGGGKDDEGERGALLPESVAPFWLGFEPALSRCAVSACPPTVRASTRRFPRVVAIRMTDNGPGILDKVRDRISEPFFTTKSAGSGTGPGSSLAFDIVTQGRDGTLAVESTEEKRAAFFVTLSASVGA